MAKMNQSNYNTPLSSHYYYNTIKLWHGISSLRKVLTAYLQIEIAVRPSGIRSRAVGISLGRPSRLTPPSAGPPGLLQRSSVAEAAVLDGIPAHGGAGAEEVRGARMEHSLRIQPSRFPGFGAVYPKSPGWHGSEKGKCAHSLLIGKKLKQHVDFFCSSDHLLAFCTRVSRGWQCATCWGRSSMEVESPRTSTRGCCSRSCTSGSTRDFSLQTSGIVMYIQLKIPALSRTHKSKWKNKIKHKYEHGIQYILQASKFVIMPNIDMANYTISLFLSTRECNIKFLQILPRLQPSHVQDAGRVPRVYQHVAGHWLPGGIRPPPQRWHHVSLSLSFRSSTVSTQHSNLTISMVLLFILVSSTVHKGDSHVLFYDY